MRSRKILESSPDVLFCAQEHLRRHTGETPYVCTDCPMRFKTRNTYKRHLRARHYKLLTASGIHEINHTASAPAYTDAKHAPLGRVPALMPPRPPRPARSTELSSAVGRSPSILSSVGSTVNSRRDEGLSAVSVNERGVSEPVVSEATHELDANERSANEPGVNERGVNEPGVNKRGVSERGANKRHIANAASLSYKWRRGALVATTSSSQSGGALARPPEALLSDNRPTMFSRLSAPLARRSDDTSVTSVLKSSLLLTKPGSGSASEGIVIDADRGRAVKRNGNLTEMGDVARSIQREGRLRTEGRTKLIGGVWGGRIEEGNDGGVTTVAEAPMKKDLKGANLRYVIRDGKLVPITGQGV